MRQRPLEHGSRVIPDGEEPDRNVVERAGFEPAYACAGRFTVCYGKAENRQNAGGMYHSCIDCAQPSRDFSAPAASAASFLASAIRCP